MKLVFAFALNNDHFFEKKHFGEAENFVLYTFENEKLAFSETLPNPYASMEEENGHGSEKKGRAIIELLKKRKVSILVSRQFGKNIRRVNQFFIPVIISEEHPETVVPILEKHIQWLQDEQSLKASDFMLFRIKNGVLKSQINPAR